MNAVNNSRVAAYLGIPYAEPPMGDLRFAAPVPKKDWKIPFEAFNFGSSCVHNDDTTFPGHKGVETQLSPKRNNY